MKNQASFTKGFELFEQHYFNRLTDAKGVHLGTESGIDQLYHITSNKLKKGNSPVILHHGRRTSHVIILTHGLSDSPHYMKAIGKRFHQEGLNVILPLLPAHGLKDPDKATEDELLDTKWRQEIDNAVIVAQHFGAVISLGGFSTGGALSYNKILRAPKLIRGGLFLFSAAIDVRIVKEASFLGFVQGLSKIVDGNIKGMGPNPFRYPHIPSFTAIELGQIIRENKRLSRDKKISQAVFAAHSVHDTMVQLDGIIDLLDNYVERGVALLISQNVPHASLPLNEDIQLDVDSRVELPSPKANPQFDMMMDNALLFFKTQVITSMLTSE
ncbi:MAG: alpha/beta hydrolase [Saprospiraceae bacterium]